MTTPPSVSSVRAAVVQASAVPFDSDACVDKAVRLIGEAAAQGARVVVFPEAFIGGYPKGLDFGLVVGARDPAGREEFRRYLDAAIAVPGPQTTRARRGRRGPRLPRRHRRHRARRAAPAIAPPSSSGLTARIWASTASSCRRRWSG